MLPSGRTFLYTVWTACNRIGIRPPGIPESWDECNIKQQAQILAFDLIREKEEYNHAVNTFGLGNIKV